MPLDRVLGQIFDALGDHAVGRRGRWRRAGSRALLPLIVLAGLIVITPLAYAGPQDPTWIAGLYDAADYDDAIGLLTDTYRHPSPAGEPGQPVAVGPMSAMVARVAACSSAEVAQIAVLFAFRLRAPPSSRSHGSFLSFGLLTLRNARNPVPAAVLSLPAPTVRSRGRALSAVMKSDYVMRAASWVSALPLPAAAITGKERSNGALGVFSDA